MCTEGRTVLVDKSALINSPVLVTLACSVSTAQCYVTSACCYVTMSHCSVTSAKCCMTPTLVLCDLSSVIQPEPSVICKGGEWSKDKTQAAESIKWRPQQAYVSNQFLLVQPQTVFSTHTKSSRSRIDKRTARATGNTRYRYSKIAPLDHKMADNCVSLARTNTLSSTITKLIKTSKTSNKSYSYNLLNRINKMYTHDLFYLQQEWEAWLAPVYIQIRTTKSQLTQCTKYKRH